jgi:alkanesulfonate monooxygenase SsuD/methylene tetrahydromethanopterin reductase-like flavin-dependent oxidoreductase (luciferase family)
MQFGLMIEPQLGMTYATQRDLALVAEAAGVEVFARSDHYAFPGVEAPHATDVFAVLAGLARDTETIRLCVLVTPVTFRHPAVVAKTAATIDEMSGGRMMLGVGTGWMEHEHSLFGLDLPEMGERADRRDEAVGYLRAAFGKAPGGFRGTHYRLEDVPIRPAPTGSLPIIVGGDGASRTPRVAGALADEYNIVFVEADEIPRRVAVARRAAADAGRPAPTISMMGGAVVGRDEASFRRNLERIAAAHPFGRSPEQIEDRARAQGVPVGAAGEAREALARLAALGIERYYVQMLGPLDHDLVEETFSVLAG